jgi:hypothetical protein
MVTESTDVHYDEVMRVLTALCVLVGALLVFSIPEHTTELLPPASIPEVKVDTTPKPNPQVAAEPSLPVALPMYKRATTTVFWVGETATGENGYIANHASYFDPRWEVHFGGIDSPTCRTNYHPCEFTPLENPFYIALPYGARDETLKNRWVEIKHDGAVCYGQWQDVGPFETGDWDYVFGTSSIPKNLVGTRAGLDVSPALRDCLRIRGIDHTQWRFVEVSDVPNGPWREIITTREAAY